MTPEICTRVCVDSAWPAHPTRRGDPTSPLVTRPLNIDRGADRHGLTTRPRRALPTIAMYASFECHRA